MAGKVELLTASNGKVALVGEDTATDVTVTVPAGTDTLLNTSSDIEAQVKTATNASGSAPIYSCRAWVNFNGAGTPSIRASGNVSSITDNGTGDYTVNFTTAMPDANYSVSGAAGNTTSTSASTFCVRLFNPDGDFTVNSCRFGAIVTGATTSANSDLTYMCISFFR